MSEVHFSEADEFDAILAQMPPSIRERVAKLPPASRAEWLNLYLNGLTESELTTLQRQLFTKITTNSGKFAKLQEYFVSL
jgi:hypothetical protein